MTQPQPSPLSPYAHRPIALTCDGIERSFGGLKALKGTTLNVHEGEIFGLVGPNGSGKTTLVNVVTGFYPPEAGTVTLFGEDITRVAPHEIARKGVARTFQNLALFKGMSVLDNILIGRSRTSATSPSTSFRWGCRSAWNWPARWWRSRTFSSWTSRWPA